MPGAVNFTTPADLIAAQAAAAAAPPPAFGQSQSDQALTASVAQAVALTRALTDSINSTLGVLSGPPGSAPR